MTTIVPPPSGAETDVIADSTLPVTSAKIEVIVEDATLAGAETEVELPAPQLTGELIPSAIGVDGSAFHAWAPLQLDRAALTVPGAMGDFDITMYASLLNAILGPL